MPLRATDNPLVLPLLGLLLEQPRHQYALLAALRERYHHLRVRTSSVYTLVGSLREAGWIAPEGSEPVVFRLTAEGAKAFRQKVAADLADTDPANATRFVTALAYVGILDRATASATLSRRVEELQERAAVLEKAVGSVGLPPVFMIETEFVAAQTRHDIAWLESFIGRIGDPAYPWPASR
ncbi:PadR family transcriptional regulator [Actinoplanes sp. RD1]|uniref:PadR family transcriptional regulator n=1 Tax=Actinoplanes sp. RD1 TaxID=3064538 RepID=UPI002742171B|nr:helix-turn-helix transcriptional regulator [Actinoplanes sp. RD1]